MEIIITLKTDQTMGKGVINNVSKTLPELIQDAVDTHNALRGENLTFEHMEFNRSDEEEAEIQAKKDNGTLIPLDEWFRALRTADYKMTEEEAEALLPDDINWPEEVFDKGNAREQAIDYMRRMPDEFAIAHLKFSINTWNEEWQVTGNSVESAAAPGQDV